MNIECWHFFQSEWQFSEHSKKTQKWVSVCSTASLLLKRVCVWPRLNRKCRAQMTTITVNHYLPDPSWCDFFPSCLPTCRKMCLKGNCGSVLCPALTWLRKDGKQTPTVPLQATERGGKWRQNSLHLVQEDKATLMEGLRCWESKGTILILFMDAILCVAYTTLCKG